jgi:hypothetical protein
MKTRRLSSLVLLLAAPAALGLFGCPLSQTGPRPPGGGVQPPPAGGAYVAGTFEGTMRIGRLRVQAKTPQATGLFVAQLGPDGAPRWLRSFASVRQGTAVATVPFRDGFIVVGVFKGDLALDTGAQTLKSADRDGLFFAHFTDTGRVRSAKLMGTAQTFASPDLVSQGGRLSVSVSYYGAASAGGQAYPEAPAGGVMRMEVSPEGDVKPQPKADQPRGQLRNDDRMLTPAAPMGRGEEPASSRMLATMLQPGKCNVCSAASALVNSNCTSCRDALCGPAPAFAGAERGCCLAGWDGTCMSSALEKCSPTTRECLCSHPTCSTGEAMLFVCSPGTPRGNCTSVVSGMDNFCNDVWWDALCVQRAQTDGGGCF